MIPEIISIGRKIEIRILQQMRQKDLPPDQVKVYNSKVADIDYERSIIYIYTPTNNSVPVSLDRDIRYVFIFYTDFGLYRAEGFCIGRKKEGNILLNAVALTTETAKFQRREYYRESCNIPVDFKEITENIEELSNIDMIREFLAGDTETISGTILDISGGGIRFSSNVRLKTGVYNIYKFDILNKGEPEEILVVGYVIASDRVEGHQAFHNRVQFIFRSDKEREKIISFVFNEQRRKRSNS